MSLENYLNFRFPTIEYLLQDCSAALAECHDRLGRLNDQKLEIDNAFPSKLMEIKFETMEWLNKLDLLDVQVSSMQSLVSRIASSPSSVHSASSDGRSGYSVPSTPILEFDQDDMLQTFLPLKQKLEEQRRLVCIRDYFMRLQSCLQQR